MEKLCMYRIESLRHKLDEEREGEGMRGRGEFKMRGKVKM